MRTTPPVLVVLESTSSRRLSRLVIAKQPLAATQHEWVESQEVLIDEIVFDECLNQLSAAEHGDVLARLLLELGDLLGDMAIDNS